MVASEREGKENILILHSWISSGHPELETYARNVGLEVEKLALDGIVVRESPVKRNFARLLREYDASWVFDLHSDVTEPYWVKREGKWIRAVPYVRKWGRYTIPPTDYSDLIERPYPICRVMYGGDVWDRAAKICVPVRNWVGEMLVRFSMDKYGVRNAFTLSAFYPVRVHERLIAFGLLYQRPLHVSVDLVKSLGEYLYERF